MNKARKHEAAWRQGQRNNVSEAEVVLVLEANGFSLRRDQGNHWLAEHPELGDHPQFGLAGSKTGRFKVNCHAFGNQGHVHPRAIRDILAALDHIRKKR